MKQSLKTLARTLLFGSVVASLTALVAQDTPSDKTPAAPDNTKVNERDRNQTAATADQQSNALTDRQITQQIRQTLIKDKSLSTYAHNVKIITQDGVVTLKGPVRSAQEKSVIEAKAAEVSGKDVKSELTVAAKN